MAFRTLLIAVAIFGLGWGASFGAGVAYGKRGAAPAVQAAAPGNQVVTFGQGAAGAGGTQAGQAGQPAQAGQGGPNAPAGAVRVAGGTIDKVEGRTLTVTGPNNQSLKVNVTDQTQIAKQAAGTIADLIPGLRVTIQPQGQPAADGTVIAATINVIPEGVFGAAGAPGAPAGQAGAAQRGQAPQGGQQAPQGQSAQRQQGSR